MRTPTLIVHRSTNEIGGNCIEIAYDGHRLILDAGNPLDDSESGIIPPSLGTSRPVDAVIVSHPHLDHYGLIRGLPEHWPVWCGKPTETLMELTESMSGNRIPQTIHSYNSFEQFTVGPFRITPFLTDHSAFDAHMLLVEVGGKSIFYSGDFRRTGRKSSLVDRMLKSPPKNVDVLLLEGTTLGRKSGFPTESDLEKQFTKLFRETSGRVFVTWSAQNIDRTVSIFRACKQSGRTLVLDIYAIDVLERLGEHYESLPQIGWPGIRGVVTSGIKRMYENPYRMNNREFFERICKSGHAFNAGKLETGLRNTVIMLRPTLLRDYMKKGLTLTAEDAWIYSMWSGYLDQQEFSDVRKHFDDIGAHFEEVHTSGHASREDLKEFATTINANHLVPIHSFDWDQHIDEFPNVRRLQDGELFELI